MRFKYIIGIGMVKTGTTSLSKALEQLGIHTLDSRLENSTDANNLITTKIKSGDPEPLRGGRYKAYNDVAFCRRHYQYLYKTDKDIGFILTFRSSLERLDSAKNFYNKPINDYEFLMEHERYHKEVLDFFGMSDRLLIIQVCGGEGWDLLCPFLKVKEPRVKFPHVNKGVKKGWGR